tara:strand:+ start:4333 stop:7896 length:3564 start_codon:yes stop_codon:yes gene_type:complete
MPESDNFGGLGNYKVSNVSEFYNDVHVYGKLYADLVGAAAVQDVNDFQVENLRVTGVSTFYGDVFIDAELYSDYLTVKHRFNVGTGGTVFTAISSEKYEDDGQFPGRVGIGTSQPDGRFQIGIGGTWYGTTSEEFESAFIVADDGNVGIGTTQPDGAFQVGNRCLTILVDPCKVGIGTTNPDAKFQIGDQYTNTFAVSTITHGFDITGASTGVVGVETTRVGIGTTTPVDTFQIGFSEYNNQPSQPTFVVSGMGTVGIGTTRAAGDWAEGNALFNESTQGKLKLDVDGSVRISRNIYDSGDSPGANGYYLNRDGTGIRWVQASPVDLDGIYVQDESVYLPTNGTAQLFQTLNFRQKNSLGLGTDTIIPIPDPANPTTIARIFSQDLWGHTSEVSPSPSDSPIYRMSKVGILNNNPQKELDVTGEAHVTGNVKFDSELEVDGDTFLNSALDVDGATTLNATLDVDGKTTFNDATDASSTTNASVQIDGGLAIVKSVIIGANAKVQSTVDSTSCNTGALVVLGGVGIAKNLNVCGSQIIDSTLQSTDCNTGALIVKGGVGIAGNLNVCGDEKIFGTTQSTNKDTGALTVEGGVGIEKNLNVGSNTKLVGTLELENRIIDLFDDDGHDATRAKNDYRLSASGVGVSWRPSGVETTNIIYVTRDGDDNNSGLLEGDAKRTIGAAAAIAQEGDTIKVRSGVYEENNPIGLRNKVTITGEDIRLVTIVPNNPNRDVIHVRNGCLIENLNFAGTSVLQDHPDCAAIAFPPTTEYITEGLSFGAVTGYTAVGPANEGPNGRYRSPYIRNCTNFMTGSIGMRINGHHVDASFTGTNDLGQDLKSMVCDAFTQYNEAGIGVSISHNAYAQLVSIFTIGCDIAIGCTSGGQCDLTNSNSSFGNYGLVADGVGAVEFDATTNTAVNGESDVVIVSDCQDFNTPNRRYRTPFDGQAAYFHLDMNDYPDSISTDSITEPMQLIRGVTVVDGGNPGDYSASAPPIITATLPQGPEAIFAEFSPNVSAAGTITSVDVIASGRNFLPTQNVTLNISGSGAAQLVADMDPILYTVDKATDNATTGIYAGITTVTFNEFIPYAIPSGTKMELVRLSRIITSSHSFEYIGAGTDINKANPFQGGKPIPENEVIAINGGQVPFTSTDQKGNFRIGDGLTIDQTTSTIRGRDFNRAIQAQLTPLILALR